jgi:predicted RNase H-like HicB family nuclease
MRYTVLVTPDREQGGYVVSVPAIPGCTTQGESMEEAIENIKDLIPTYLAELAARGEAVPVEDEPPQLEVVDVPVPA